MFLLFLFVFSKLKSPIKAATSGSCTIGNRESTDTNLMVRNCVL